MSVEKRKRKNTIRGERKRKRGEAWLGGGGGGGGGGAGVGMQGPTNQTASHVITALSPLSLSLSFSFFFFFSLRKIVGDNDLGFSLIYDVLPPSVHKKKTSKFSHK